MLLLMLYSISPISIALKYGHKTESLSAFNYIVNRCLIGFVLYFAGSHYARDTAIAEKQAFKPL